MRNACKEEVWHRILSINFSIFLHELKKNLNNDLVNFFYFRFRIFSSIFHKLPLHSVFAHFCYCKRICDQKKTNEFYCEFCSRVFPQVFDNHIIFEYIIIDECDFSEGLNKLFEKDSPFSLRVCYNHALSINTPRAKLYKCTYFTFIRKPKKLYKRFLLSMLRLLRLYLNYFCSLLSEIELEEEQKIFFRQQIWIFAADLMYGFCLNAKFEYFNNLK